MSFKDFDETLEMLLEQRDAIRRAPEETFEFDSNKETKLREIEKEIEEFLVMMGDE